jgi:hypothetical protein
MRSILCWNGWKTPKRAVEQEEGNRTLDLLNAILEALL